MATEIPIKPSTIETIDQAVYNWLKSLKLATTTNGGWKRVPVIWASAERTYQSKNSKELRDSAGTLIFPIITIERTAINKNLSRKGPWWGNVPPYNDVKGGSITVTRTMNQDKTSNFANADAYRKTGQINFPRKNEKIVYQQKTMPMPVYIEVSFTINMRTEYQQQVNDLMTPFITKPGGINYLTLEEDGHFYEGFLQQTFSHENNMSSMEQTERKFQSRVDLNVLGYLIGEDKNQEAPKIVIRENTVDVKFPREKIMIGDFPE